MNIQEVSKKTQLSDKTIRYYESIGLIRVHRQENGYRSYTESDVKRLYAIRLMRSVSMSIEDIKKVLSDPQLWPSVLERYQCEFEAKQKEDEKKTLLFCALHATSYDELFDQSEELMDAFHDEELFELIDNIKSPSLFSTIIKTLIISGPILGLLLTTYTDVQFPNQHWIVPIALFSTGLLTFLWMDYFKHKNPNIQRSNTWVSFGLLVVSLVLIFVPYIGASLLRETLYLTPQSIIYTSNSIYLDYTLLLLAVIQITAIFYGIRYTFKKDYDFEHLNMILNAMRKYWCIVVGINLMFMYIFITSVTVVNNDGSLVRFSPINPKGTQFSVEDINSVTVGFTHGPFKQYKPEFSMILTTDQFSVNIGGASFVSETSDTYLELEILDALYMSKGIPKIVKNRDIQKCTIDMHYCNRFLRIVDNIE